jgi:hypothetical protein
VDHPLPWLRYVDASNVNAPEIAFDGMKVRNDAMEKLGNVEGFVVDNKTMRPYYVVVDSGGWFKSKDFLIPIGHARIDDDRDALVVDIPKERIERFPGFDRDEFARLGEEDIRRMNDAICEACSDTSVLYTPSDPLSTAWARPEYTQPDWWATVSPPLAPGADLGPAENNFVPTEDYAPTKVARANGELQAEDIAARERERERELVMAREAEASPHFEGRAQPGDVIGVETGGEQTHVGETSEDEDRRRIEAQREEARRRRR